MSPDANPDDAALTLSREAYGDAGRLRARIALHGLGAGDREDFHDWLWRLVEAPAAAADLPFADGRFDLVFANHMLYHVPALPRAIAELGRVLRRGGRLIAATNGDDHLAEIAVLLRELVEDRLRDGPLAVRRASGAFVACAPAR